MPLVMNKSFLTFKFRFFLLHCMQPRACPCGAARSRRQKCQDLRSQRGCQPGFKQLESPPSKELPDRAEWSFRWFPWQPWKGDRDLSPGRVWTSLPPSSSVWQAYPSKPLHFTFYLFQEACFCIETTSLG